MRTRGRILLVVIGSMLLLGSIAGCGGFELQSHWRTQEITIDGEPMDWDGVPSTYSEAPNIAFRVLNDDSHMYVFMSSPDYNVLAQIMGRGMTVWFDPQGEKEKIFGVRYPGQMQNQASMRTMMGDPSKLRERLLEMIDEPFDHLELVGPVETLIARLPVTQTQDIRMDFGYRNQWFICELAVPLYQTDEHPYAIGAKSDRRISLGFETPEIDREALMKATRPGGGMPGGTGGMGGGPAGGMGGGRLAKMPDRRMMQPLKLWTKVALADEANAIEVKSTTP